MKINLKNSFYIFFLVSLSFVGSDIPSYNGSEVGYLFDHPFLQSNIDLFKKWKECTYATATKLDIKTWGKFGTYNPETPTHKIKWRHGKVLRVVEKATKEEVYDIGFLGGNNSLYFPNYHVSAFSSDGQSLVISHGGEIQRPVISNKPYREIVGLSLVKGKVDQKFKIKNTDQFCARLTAIAISNDGRQCFTYDAANKKIVWFKEGKLFKEIPVDKKVLKLGYQEFSHRLVLISETGTINFVTLK